MKNAADYEKKLKKFLAPMRSRRDTAQEMPPVELLIVSVLEENASRKAALKAIENIRAEYVDWNELRVSQPKEILETIGKDYPQGRIKIESLLKAMNLIFDRTYDLTLEAIAKMPKRDLRRYMLEVGLSPYVAAAMMLQEFGGHAIPVDRHLADLLEINELVYPDSEIDDIQGFLERVINQKDALKAHEFFRQQIEKSAKQIAKFRQHKQAQLDKQEREAKEAAAKAQAAKEAAQKAAEAKQAAKEAAQAKRAKKAKTAKKTKSAPKTKVAKKPAKAAKKPAPKATKKVAKSAARKTTTKASTTSAKKTTKKTVKKSAAKSAKKKK